MRPLAESERKRAERLIRMFGGDVHKGFVTILKEEAHSNVLTKQDVRIIRAALVAALKGGSK